MNLFLAVLSAVFSLVTAITFWLSRSAFRSFPLNILFLVIILSGVTDALSTTMAFYKIPNIDLINVFFVVQFTLLMLFLLSYYKHKLLLVCVYIIVLVIIACSVFEIHDNFNQFKIASRSISMQGLLITLLALYILLNKTLDAKKFLTQDHEFWFISAIVLYFSLSTVCFVTAEMPLHDSKFIRNFTWFINSISSIFSNILYLIGLRCLRKHMKLSLQHT